MAEYKIVYKDDVASGGILWEPGCPLFTSAVQIARDTNTAACFLQLKFKNISDEVIVGFKGEAVVTFADNTREEHNLKYLDADIAPRAFFRPKALPLKGSEPISVEITISEVTQPESAWSSAGKPEPLPKHKPLHLSAVAQAERDAELVDLEKEPANFSGAIEDHGTWWLCSCGAVNVGNGTCFRCRLSKEQILQLQDEEYLNEASKIRAKEMIQRKKHLKLIAIIAAVVVALFLAGLIVNSFVVQPMLEAQKQEQEKHREEAFDGREIVGHSIKTTSASDPSTFKQINLKPGDSYYLYLSTDGSCKLSVSTSILTDISGTWSIETDRTVAVSLPDYGGDWSASLSEDYANLVLTNTKDANVWISFPIK